MQWIITGYSGKLFGFIFSHTAESQAAALRKLNGQYRDYTVVEFVDKLDPSQILLYLLETGSDWTPHRSEYEEYDPRHSGWALSISKVDNDGFANDAVCW